MKPEIATFALRYLYRIGSVVPLEDNSYLFTLNPDAERPHAWPFPSEIRFAFEPHADEAVHFLGLGSPLLREILEACQKRGAVSYRHLLSEEVPVLSHFQDKLPIPLEAMSCTGVQQRLAIGFVHLSRYDAPAMGKSQEETRLDVLDWDSGEPLEQLGDRLFELVTTPGAEIPPPDPDRVDWLHERARYLSNYKTERKARQVEAELQSRLTEELARNRAYHDQQRDQFKEKEHALLGRIEQLESKLPEARTPLSKERLQGDLEATWEKLRQVTDGIHRELARVNQQEEAKAHQERQRHELTVTTDLVNACLISFDVVTYALVTQAGGQLTATFTPVTGEWGMPTCHGCRRPPVALDAKGHPVCQECLGTCPRCPSTLCPACVQDARRYGGCPDCHVSSAPLFSPEETAPMAQEPPSPDNRIIDLPQVIRQRQSPPTQRKMCPQCGSSQAPHTFATCPCCGVGVCQGCRGDQSACRTCENLAPPSQDPNWLKEVRRQHPDFAKVRHYCLADNKRYGVVQWKTFGGERVLVFDMWHRQVAMDRQKGLITALKRVLNP